MINQYCIEFEWLRESEVEEYISMGGSPKDLNALEVDDDVGLG